MRRNYKAWNIDDGSFPSKGTDVEKLIFLCRYAVLAPSGHNSQPWKINSKKKSLQLLINYNHYITGNKSGLLTIEPYVSLGTFIETLVVAAKGHGYKLNIKYVNIKPIEIDVSINSRTPPDRKLLKSIKTRASNRNNFKKTRISNTTMKNICSGVYPAINIRKVTDTVDMHYIAEQTEIAITSIMSKPRYRQELSEWVRANNTRKYDGMPGFTHGISFIPSLAAKVAIKYLSKNGPQASKSKSLIINSGALVIVSCSTTNILDCINAGRSYANICIMANYHGYATSALGASVTDPLTKNAVEGYFKLKLTPQFILRIGKSTTPPSHSPRWPLAKLLN
jgi:hypothetical protein